MSQERASLASQESTEGPRHPWWTVLRRIGSPAIRLMIVAAVVEFALLPQLAGARAAIHQLSGISPTWLATGLIAQILSLLAYARLSQISLDAPGVGYGQLLRVDLATLAVSHVVPAGSAVGIGLGYRLLTRSGVPSDRAVTGKALQTVGSAVVLNLMLGGALVAALVTHGNNPLYAPIAAVGLALILAATIGAALVARSEGWLTRTVVRTLQHLPKVDAESGARLIASLAGTVRRLVGDRRFLFRIILWATLNWLFEALALWCCVKAFGHTLGPVG
ncbi:MAG TPA: YbhN family protein, partial [Frankiaceae bacterium]|nr:YbhN family protein [Frankiaceae bacterium]